MFSHTQRKCSIYKDNAGIISEVIWGYTSGQSEKNEKGIRYKHDGNNWRVNSLHITYEQLPAKQLVRQVDEEPQSSIFKDKNGTDPKPWQNKSGTSW
jgi:hypothetical protein